MGEATVYGIQDKRSLLSSKCLNTIRILLTQENHYSDGEQCSDDASMRDEKVHEYANGLRAEYAEASLDHPEWRPMALEVMDRNGRIF